MGREVTTGGYGVSKRHRCEGIIIINQTEWAKMGGSVEIGAGQGMEVKGLHLSLTGMVVIAGNRILAAKQMI